MPAAILFAWLMATIRGSAFMLLLPALTGTPIPVMLRMALAVSVATLVSPAVTAQAQIPGSLPALILAIAAEVLVGLFLGLVGRLTFYTIEMAGRVIATEIGLTATPGIEAPTASNEPFAAFLYRFAVLLYFLAGGHLLAIGAFARSFVAAPPGLAGLAPDAPDQFIHATALMFAAGVQLSAPFIAINFLVTLAFGLLGRTVPKINVFLLSLSGRSIAGILMLGGAGALFARYLIGRFAVLPAEILSYVPLKP